MRVLAILLLLTVPVSAQRFDDTITVDVVDVPVYVESDGVPLQGLTRDDFALFVDGRPHPIEYFDVIEEMRADTLLNDIPQNGVTLDLAVEGTEVTASIPGVELLAYRSGKPLLPEAFFYVFDQEGRPFSWNALRVAVDLDKGREFLSANPYRMRQDLVLQPGRYVVKALVRIAGTERVGFDRAELAVAR